MEPSRQDFGVKKRGSLSPLGESLYSEVQKGEVSSLEGNAAFSPPTTSQDEFESFFSGTLGSGGGDK